MEENRASEVTVIFGELAEGDTLIPFPIILQVPCAFNLHFPVYPFIRDDQRWLDPFGDCLGVIAVNVTAGG